MKKWMTKDDVLCDVMPPKFNRSVLLRTIDLFDRCPHSSFSGNWISQAAIESFGGHVGIMWGLLCAYFVIVFGLTLPWLTWSVGDNLLGP